MCNMISLDDLREACSAGILWFAKKYGKSNVPYHVLLEDAPIEYHQWIKQHLYKKEIRLVTETIFYPQDCWSIAVIWKDWSDITIHTSNPDTEWYQHVYSEHGKYIICFEPETPRTDTMTITLPQKGYVLVTEKLKRLRNDST